MQLFQKMWGFYEEGAAKMMAVVNILFFISVVALLSPDQSLAIGENSFLPLEIGSGWELRDDMGRFQILIKGKEIINNEEYYRVDWIDDMLGGRYQSEYWVSRNDGVYVTGRYVLGKLIMFEKPYLLLKHRLKVGEKWEGNIQYASFSDTLEFRVEKKEVIKTGIGDFEALKVVLTGRALRVIRWYSLGVGIVKETTFKKEKNGFVLLNEKVLAHRIAVSEDRNQRANVPVFSDQDLEKYKKSDTRFADSQQMEADKPFYSNTPPKNAKYESMLAGT